MHVTDRNQPPLGHSIRRNLQEAALLFGRRRRAEIRLPKIVIEIIHKLDMKLPTSTKRQTKRRGKTNKTMNSPEERKRIYQRRYMAAYRARKKKKAE